MKPRFRVPIGKGFQGFVLIALCMFIGQGITWAANERAVLVLSQLNVNPTMAYAFVAEKIGYWSQEGLDVEIQYSKGSAQTLQLLAVGKADIGQSNEIQLMLAREKGVPLKVVMTFNREFGSRMGVLANSPIKSIQQLRGQIIGVASLSAAQVPFARAMVATGGLNPDTDVTLVPVGFGAQPLALLLSGRVAAVAFWTSQFSVWEIAGHDFRYFPAPFFPNDVPGYNFVAHEDLIGDRRTVLVGLLRGIAKGILFSQTDPEAALKLFYRANPTKKPVGVDAEQKIANDLELLKRGLTLSAIEGRRIEQWGANYKPGWEAVRDFYIAQGTLHEKRDVEEYYVSPRVTDEINRFDAEDVVKSAANYQ